MESFIEVVGSATLLEEPVEYRADLNIVVRAAQAENAMKEVGELRSQCIRVLKDAGLTEKDLREGGAEMWRPWFWRKKPGREAMQKILVSCSDVQPLYQALSHLEPLFENQRYSLSVSMRKPHFSASDDARIQARRGAVADAREKATALASEGGLMIKGISQIEELAEKTSASGMFGDQDWGGYAFAGAAVGAADDDSADEPGYEKMEGAHRIATLRFRVRFVVEPA